MSNEYSKMIDIINETHEKNLDILKDVKTQTELDQFKTAQISTISTTLTHISLTLNMIYKELSEKKEQ